MTLKQKFFDVYTKYYKKSNELDKMVEVADDHAIGFAEWVLSRSLSEDLRLQDDVIEKYKKEKGL